jgi:hypothetical protein
MSTVPEIVDAAAHLDPDQFVHLREELDRLEERIWKAELARTSTEMNVANLTDEEIDRLVMKRRRESRN